jgi:hypothetical protein
MIKKPGFTDPLAAFGPLPRGPVVARSAPIGGYGPQRGGEPNVTPPKVRMVGPAQAPRVSREPPRMPVAYGPPNLRPGSAPGPMPPVATTAVQQASKERGMAINAAKLREGAKNLRNGGG